MYFNYTLVIQRGDRCRLTSIRFLKTERDIKFRKATGGYIHKIVTDRKY